MCSRMSENTLLAKYNIIVFIIYLHAKEEKLIPQPSYANISILLLHAYVPMLEAKSLIPVGQCEDKACHRYLAFASLSALRRKKCPIPQEGCHIHIVVVG